MNCHSSGQVQFSFGQKGLLLLCHQAASLRHIASTSLNLSMKTKLLLSITFIVASSFQLQRNYQIFLAEGKQVPYDIQKKIICSNGAFVSAHTLASKVGVDILNQGGNAIDASIATQLALAVVYPEAGNIGGGGFTVARLSNGKMIALDYREMGRGKATRDMYIDANGNARTDKSQNGHL